MSGRAVQRAVRALLNTVTKVYFKPTQGRGQIEVRGLRNLPQGACILAGNHPCGVLDSMVLMAALPDRRITSVAKHSLFGIFPIGFFLKMMEAIPVAKAVDANLAPDKQATPEERKRMNKEMFRTVVDRLRDGTSICIFPEGTCHSLPEIKELKTGTARMALEAAASGWDVPLVPVGLSYSEPSGSTFRGSVLVDIGRPIYVNQHLEQFQSDSKGATEACQDVTNLLQRHLHHVTVAAPDWTLELVGLCEREGWAAPVYDMSGVEAKPGSKPAFGHRELRCRVRVCGKQYTSRLETVTQARRRRTEETRAETQRLAARWQAGARLPAAEDAALFCGDPDLKREAARAAFFDLSGGDGGVSDEEFVDVIHLMRHVYKPDNRPGFSMSLTQYSALTRNLMTGYLRTGCMRDPDMQKLWKDLVRYGTELRRTNVTDAYVAKHEVNSDPMGDRLKAMRKASARQLARLVVVVPLTLVGSALHWHIGALSSWAGDRFGVDRKTDDRSVVATVKVIAGFIGCIGTWPLVTGAACAVTSPVYAPAWLGLCVASGYVAATEDSVQAELARARRKLRMLRKDDTVDRLRITRADLKQRTREVCDRYCDEELRGWWREPAEYVDTIRVKQRAWEAELCIVREGDLAAAGLTTYRIPLAGPSKRHKLEDAVLTCKQVPANSKALIWLPGRNDSFFHTHVLDDILESGFDVFALDLRRCGRALTAPDGTQVCPRLLAHDSYDFHEYFEELDAVLRWLKTPTAPHPGPTLQGGCGKFYEKIVVYAHSTGGLIAALYGAEGGGAWRGAIDGYVFNSPFWKWNVSWHTGLAMRAVAEPGAISGMIRGAGLADDMMLAAGGDSNEYSLRMKRVYHVPEELKSSQTLAVTVGWVRAVTEVQTRLQNGNLLLDRPILSLFTKADDVLNYKDIDILNTMLCRKTGTPGAGEQLKPGQQAWSGHDRPLSSTALVEREIPSTPAEPSGHDVLAAESAARVRDAVHVVTSWLSAQFGDDAGGAGAPRRRGDGGWWRRMFDGRAGGTEDLTPEQAFHALDTNKDGMVDEEEFKAALAASRRPPPSAAAA